MKGTRVRMALAVGAAVLLLPHTAFARVNYSDASVVKEIQEKLNAAGFDCGTPDGVAGSGTKKAIQAYREAKSLTQGDQIDAELLNSLLLSREQYGFVQAVTDSLAGNLGSGESAKEVTLYNNDLCVVVDLGDTSQSQLPAEELAYSRVSSLTDGILEIESGDHLWQTITIDFGSLGEVVNGKDNIADNGYGRYFDSSKFQLTGGNGAAAEAASTDADSSKTAAPEGVTPEVKEYLDAYETFMNKYCDFMENYDATDLSALMEYMELLKDYEDFAKKIDAMDESAMTDEDYKYYIDVNARIQKRLIEASN